MSTVSAGKKKRRRWWLLALVIVVVAAAVAGGVWWFLGRDSTGAVHYLTATSSTGTISQTVETDFTLASDGGVSSMSLAGSSSTSSNSSGTTATGVTASLTGTSSASTVFASFESSSPSPTPTASVEPTSTPAPSPTETGMPVPTPSQSAVVIPSGQSGGLASSSGGASTSSAASATGATSTTASSGLSGVVTHLFAKEGSKPRTLQRLLTVSGKGVFAFVSSTPLWTDLSTDLSTGEQKVNVAVLQQALKADGSYAGKINGNFTSATESAYKRWQADHGMSKTGIVSVDRFVWMPTGSVVSSWSVTLGSNVSGGTSLAALSAPSALEAQALVSQSDLGELKVGQKAQMTIDGYTDEAFTGVITAISDEPASSSTAASGSTGSTQYTITIRPQDLPSVARLGMTGTLEIVLQEHADVLLVPTSAVTGTSSTSYVRVMMNGTPTVRQVETGMATSAYTEITSGLTEGETVVTGQYTDGATSTGTSSTTQSGGLGGSILGGSSGGPPAGMPMPQGGAPAGQGGGQ